MSSIHEFVPRTSQTIDRIGFLLGAGASYEAGYPLVFGLTESVIRALTPDERQLLDDILAQKDQSYEEQNATPNIEEIADIVGEHFANSQQRRSAQLQKRLQDLVYDVIMSVKNPKIDNHVALLTGLQSRCFNRPTQIYIITTNYNLLIEEAATEVGIRVVNGFTGVIRRFFSEKEFSLSYGTLKGSRFEPDSSLTVVLIKLHGSVSWFLRNNVVNEVDPACIDSDATRCMVLPRRTKVRDTLRPPYDRLFSICKQILGGPCKYIIAAGFSFGDQHINDEIIFPKLQSGEISLTNFCDSEPFSLKLIRSRPNVRSVCSSEVIHGGKVVSANSRLWKFGEFVKLF